MQHHFHGVILPHPRFEGERSNNHYPTYSLIPRWGSFITPPQGGKGDTPDSSFFIQPLRGPGLPILNAAWFHRGEEERPWSWTSSQWIRTLNWINILKLAHKSLYDEMFPEYLKLNIHEVSAYSLRSSIAPVLSIPRESGKFQHSAATIFDKLAVAIRNITEYNSFCRSVKRHLLCKET